LSARGWLGSRYSVMVVGMVSSGVVATSYRGGGSSPWWGYGVGLEVGFIFAYLVAQWRQTGGLPSI
jgi:hypothetical protein